MMDLKSYQKTRPFERDGHFRAEMTIRQRKFIEAKALVVLVVRYLNILEGGKYAEYKDIPAETIKVVTDGYRRLLASDEFIIKACQSIGEDYRKLLDRLEQVVKPTKSSDDDEDTDDDAESISVSE